MRGRRWVAILTVSLVTLAAAAPQVAAKSQGPSQPAKVVELRVSLRDLWVDQIFWMRALAWETRSGDEEAAKVAGANLALADRAFGDAVAAFYGKDLGDKVAKLLSGHREAAESYMAAAFSGSAVDKAQAAKALNANGYEIAVLLNGANANWPLVGLVSLLSAYIQQTAREIDLIGARDYVSEAEAWAVLKRHVYALADTLTDGLAKQFPHKF